MSQPLCILIVEDSDDDVFLLQRTLRQGGYEVTCEVVETSSAMRSAIKSQKWNVITCDHSMPRFDAPAALALAKELCPDVPFIIVSGEINLNLAVSLMRSGAKDYIQKHELPRLIPSIERELREVELRREQLRMDEALKESNERLREVMENSLDASYKRNLLTNSYDYFSPVVTRISGYTPEEMKSMPFETVLGLIHPDDVAEIERVMAEVLSGENHTAQVEYRFINKAGQYQWLQDRFTVLRGAEGQPLAMIGSISDITERKWAEDALRNAKNQYDNLVSNIPVGVYIMRNTPQGAQKFEYVSPKMAEMLAVSAESILADPRVSFGPIHPEDIASLLKLNQERFQHPQPFEWEGRAIVNGAVKWLHIQSSPEPLENGESLWHGIIEEITERKQAEEALKESELRYRSLIEYSKDAIFCVDENGQYQFANHQFASTFGKTPDYFIGKTFRDVYSKEHADLRFELINRLFQSGESQIFDIVVPVPGKTLYFHTTLNPIKNEAGKVVSALAYSTDITEQKQAEQELRESETRLKKAQHFAHMGSWTWNIKTNQLDWSDEMYRVFGLEKETLRGSLEEVLATAIHPDDRSKLVQSRLAVIQNKPFFSLEFRVIWPDQSVHVIWEEVGEFKLDEAGHPALLSGIAQDITGRKEAEEQIRRLNTELEARVAERTAQLTAANRELEAFSYSVSHDLRAPLRALDGFSEILIADYQEKLDKQGQGYLARIQESSRRMGKLIEDLLKLSQITRADFTSQEVNLSRMAYQIAADLKTQSPQRQVEFDIQPHMIVQGDENLLHIALENLLNNAYKFTQRREQAVIQIGILEQDGKPVYFIRDNGAGFDMTYAYKLFGPFQRLHSEKEFPGTGIGLTTVQRIIHRHNGRIWAEAVEEEGAAFYFTIGS